MSPPPAGVAQDLKPQEGQVFDEEIWMELRALATCNPGGAGKWDETWCMYFARVPAYK